MISDPASQDDLRRKAVRRANAKLGFRTHLIAFMLVNLGLAVLNLVTSPGYLWFPWPLFGWGVGLLAHGLSVYGVSSSLREEMIARELERLREGSQRRR